MSEKQKNIVLNVYYYYFVDFLDLIDKFLGLLGSTTYIPICYVHSFQRNVEDGLNVDLNISWHKCGNKC